MVLVDTSIWIDFFQNNDSIHAQTLDGLIRDNNRAVICGVVLQEILQGIKDNNSYELTKERLSRLPFLDANKETYIYASSLYRTLRRKGITVPSVDTTIAAIAVLNRIPLFTKDEHFKTIARYSELKLF
ncbi:MAG: PIN domain nuclease [Nitrospirae bacterium]|nr:PIN domain nuclease [Nitrospirota bacterium]MDA8339316.1 PIN domain nuclease [Nitrospiraceae bacterium]